MKKTIIILISISLVSLAIFASDMITTRRALNFSGYEWQVRHSLNKKNLPGPNYWSDKNVRVDEEGNLHLKLTSSDDKWYSSEVTLTSGLGYGEYVFYVTLKEPLDKNVVLGMFNYHDDEHEIAIELAKWGNEDADNAQYTVQPLERAEGIAKWFRSFNYPDSVLTQTHKFIWKPERIDYQSQREHKRFSKDPSSQIQKWSYLEEEEIPKEYSGEEEHLQVHINLWLQDGTPPSNQEEVEVVIEKFEFFPLNDEQAN